MNELRKEFYITNKSHIQAVTGLLVYYTIIVWEICEMC